jgi:CubicO group peptidase (beta-lactamase class C family)
MRYFRPASFALALALCASNAPAIAETPPTMNDAIAAIRAFAPQALAFQGAPGMVVAITDGTQTIAIIPVGYADVASKTPVTETTRFGIGSITKSFTALALLRLHDQGLVDLNAPVARYLPWWKLGDATAPILVHNLLSHTGGVPDDYSFAPNGFALAALRGAAQLFPAGTAWSYSNDGLATAGEIVAARSGMRWQDDLTAAILAPLHMTGTTPVFTIDDANLATGYIYGTTAVATPPDAPLMAAQRMDFVDAAGSLISTGGDMAAYMRLYLNGGRTADGTQLISKASFEAMTHADRLANGKPAGAAHAELAEWPEFYRQYGYGLGVFTTNGDHLVGHTGGIQGYTACMQVNLTQGFGVIAMSNKVEAPLHPCQIVKYAMSVLRAQKLGQALPAAPVAGPIPPPKVNAADYAGTYRASGRTVEVRGAGGTLSLADGGKTFALVAEDDDLFWTDDPAFPIYYLAFERNAKNIVDGFTFGGTVYAGAAYRGPAVFRPSARDARLAGRYQVVVYGNPDVVRIVPVKGQLTIDGLQPLQPRPDGTFRIGHSTVRFDTLSGGKMQRMWLDGTDLYRVELP